MSTSTTAPAPSRKRKRGPYSYSKCEKCRKDKKKCEPIERPADQPCHRCQEKGLQCSSHEDIRKNDTAPAPSLSDNNSVITSDLQDPVMQCLHLYNWYRIMPFDVPIKEDFRQALLDVLAFTWKNSMNSDSRGKALLAQVTSMIDMDLMNEAYEDLKDLCLGSVKQPGSPMATELEFARSLWDAGYTHGSISTLRHSLSDIDLSEEDKDEEEGLTLQIVRQYFCFLKSFWDINGQLLKIGHAQLASLAPQLQRYIEIQDHLDLASTSSSVCDLILDEEPTYYASIDGYGNTLLHYVAERSFLGPPHLQNMQKILDSGIDVNIKNHMGQTALHVICKEYYISGLITYLKLMIQHKEIDINAQNERGETALHILCGNCSKNNGYLNMLELVLGHQDIDVGIRDKDGRIPADCLPQETKASLLEEHPFLQRLYQSSSLAHHPQGTDAGQNGSTYTPLPPEYFGAYTHPPFGTSP